MPNDQRMRELVARYGLKVRCTTCAKQLRHFPESQGRLAQRPCPYCGSRLRDERWHQRQAREKGYELPPFTVRARARP